MKHALGGGHESTHRFLVAKPEGKRPVGKLRCQWKGDIQTDLKNMVWVCGLDSSGSEWDSVAGCFEHGNETLGFMKGMEFLD